MKIILASASPRRRELLSEITPRFEVVPSAAEENIQCREPETLVKRLAELKASSVFAKHGDCLVIGADTVVAFDGEVLGKPRDAADAKDMLRRLSGNTHTVITGVCVMTKDISLTFAEKSFVRFKRLSDRQIDDYIATGSPLDKAGAYGIQDSGFAERVEGSVKNVVGLPIERLAVILKEYGG